MMPRSLGLRAYIDQDSNIYVYLSIYMIRLA